MISVFDYTSWQVFVRDWLADSGTSMRALGRSMGVSHSLLSRQLRGERRLDESHHDPLARALGLEDSEREYFLALITVDQDPSRTRRRPARALIRGVQTRKRARPIDDESWRLLAHWHVGAISELARCEGFRDDPAWIASHLVPPITERMAADALGLLEEIGILERGPTGQLTPAPRANWSTDHQVSEDAVDAALRSSYRWSIPRALEALDELEAHDRQFGTVILSASEEGFQQVKEQIGRFYEHLMLTSSQEEAPTRVFQVGVQMFVVGNAVSRSRS